MREEGGYRNERERERRPRRGDRPQFQMSGQVIVGATIVIFGLALLLDNLGIIRSSRDILRFWPLILVGAGINDLFRAQGRGRALRGTLLAAFGILFLLNNLGIVGFRVWDLWPLFLILFGFHMLMRSRSGPVDVNDKKVDVNDEETVDASLFDDFACLGAVKRSITSSSFKGGAATAFMGGVELNLRHAQMEGDRAVINVFALMGGVSMRVPDDWTVESRVVAILGGVDDKTRPPRETTKILVLQGTVIMGGVEIKD